MVHVDEFETFEHVLASNLTDVGFVPVGQEYSVDLGCPGGQHLLFDAADR